MKNYAVKYHQKGPDTFFHKYRYEFMLCCCLAAFFGIIIAYFNSEAEVMLPEQAQYQVMILQKRITTLEGENKRLTGIIKNLSK